MWSIIKSWFGLKADAQISTSDENLPRVAVLKNSGLYNYKNAATHEIYCPACQTTHGFDETWVFNQDFVNPTIHPSLLISNYISGKRYVCHSYIRNGYIYYLGDCTHCLKSQTVRLPPIDQK